MSRRNQKRKIDEEENYSLETTASNESPKKRRIEDYDLNEEEEKGLIHKQRQQLIAKEIEQLISDKIQTLHRTGPGVVVQEEEKSFTSFLSREIVNSDNKGPQTNEEKYQIDDVEDQEDQTLLHPAGEPLHARDWLKKCSVGSMSSKARWIKNEAWRNSLIIPSFPSVVPNIVKLTDSRSFYLPLEAQSNLRRRTNFYNVWRQYVSVCLMMTRARHYELGAPLPNYYSTCYDKESYRKFSSHFYPPELIESEIGVTTKRLNEIRQEITQSCVWKPTVKSLIRDQKRGQVQILFLTTNQKFVAKETDSYPLAPSVSFRLVTTEKGGKATQELLNKQSHYIGVYPEEIPLNFSKVCHKFMEMMAKGRVKPSLSIKLELFGTSDTMEDPYERPIVSRHEYVDELVIRSVENKRRISRHGLPKLLHIDPIVRLHGFDFEHSDIVSITEYDLVGQSKMYYVVSFDDSRHSSKKDRNASAVGSGGMVSVPSSKKKNHEEGGS